jgi:hypothetical protein
MYAPWSRLLVAFLLAASPFAALAAADIPAPTAAPQRLVVDAESSPVVSIHDAAQLVEIVLIPSNDYRPVHPDSIDTDAGDGSADTDDPK